jgi:Tfp pilus assembly protein PilF
MEHWAHGAQRHRRALHRAAARSFPGQLLRRAAGGPAARGVPVLNAAALLPQIEAALDRHAPGDALAACERALARDPHDARAHRHRASLLAAAGHFDAAEAAGRRACECAPDDAGAWSDLGRVYALRARFEDAALCFREALDIDARHADAWHNLGTALRRLGRTEEAFHALKQALLIDPARAGTYLNLGGLLVESGQLDDARECFERAARFDPALAQTHSRLAAHLAACGRPRRAQELYRHALGLDATHVESWLGLGQALEDLGDAQGALSCYRTLLTVDGGHAGALGRYLALLRAPAPAALIAAATRALGDPQRTDAGRALIGYGLARHLDRHGVHREAAAAGRAANGARRREAGPFDRAALDARVAEIIGICDASFFAQRRGFGLGTDQPVFIVGLPRSGTTLTEQIVASHPLLHGAGELPDLPRLAAGLFPDAPWRAAAALAPDSSRALGRRYLERLRDGAPTGRLRITDKSPFNFFQLGFAALLFPQARVIHCRRGARDNALSIWLENFNPDQHYATDFADLAHLRRAYERLMAHWRAVLPLRVLDVDYEDLVADVEAGARRIIDFLDTPWDRRCLEFHRSERAVQTPSRWQVRQKIYSSSVDRWRHYAPHLPELLAAFPEPA